jgi:hypothetical protein
VNKDFQPNNPANVTVSLSCTTGAVANDDTTASESDPANFTVTGFSTGTTCTATETPPGGYLADQSNCQNVPITPGGTASCTIINQLAGTIAIVKDAVPNDPQDFDFACSGLLGTFTLDDDGTNGNPLSNNQTFSDIAPGNYICTEQNEPGWSTSITCSDPDNGSTGSGYSANIDLDPGETVTCTFTNSFVPGPPAVGGTAGLLDEASVIPVSAEERDQRDVAAYLVAALGSVLLASAGILLLRRQAR